MPSPRRQVAHDARPQLDRRTVLIGASAGAAALVAGRHAAAADKPSLPTADTLIAGKDRRLIVYNTKVFEIETPLELLREQNITPAQALFVRNNQQPAWALTLSPADTKDWTVEVAGLVEFPRSITLSRLAEL